jgi:sugar phosphate isomerase/epimerase
MTILQLTTIHPNPGVKWEDVQKQIKKACDLARKHGAENVTVTVTMIGGDQHDRRAL